MKTKIEKEQKVTTGENIQTLLRCLKAGYNTVFETPKGEYVSIQCKNFDENKGLPERSIESRLQYELYGEWPLSDKDELDWIKNIKPLFKF